MIEIILVVVTCALFILFSINPLIIENSRLRDFLIKIDYNNFIGGWLHNIIFWRIIIPTTKALYYLVGIEDTLGNDDNLPLSNEKSGLYKLTSSLTGKRSIFKTYKYFSTEIKARIIRWKIENMLMIEHVKFNFHWFRGPSFEINGVEDGGIAAADANLEDRLIRFFSGFFRFSEIQQVWTICHEFAHILLEHSGRRYNAEFTASANGMDEREADTLGLILMNKLGYDVTPLKDCFTTEGCYNNPISLDELNVEIAHFEETRLDGYVATMEGVRFAGFEEIVSELIPDFRNYMTW